MKGYQKHNGLNKAIVLFFVYVFKIAHSICILAQLLSDKKEKKHVSLSVKINSQQELWDLSRDVKYVYM